MNLLEKFNGRRVLITGGLGFIGSALARSLVEAGADVTLVDSLIPEYGGNLFNIEPFRERGAIPLKCEPIAHMKSPNLSRNAARGQLTHKRPVPSLSCLAVIYDFDSSSYAFSKRSSRSEDDSLFSAFRCSIRE